MERSCRSGSAPCRVAERGDGVPDEATADGVESSATVAASSERHGMTRWGVGAERVVEPGAERRPNHAEPQHRIFASVGLQRLPRVFNPERGCTGRSLQPVCTEFLTPPPPQLLR
jgi:hypothetical protein